MSADSYISGAPVTVTLNVSMIVTVPGTVNVATSNSDTCMSLAL